MIVAKTLAKDIDERYPSAAELAADLRACRLQRAGPVQVAPAYAAPDGIASITAELFADTMPEPIVEQGAGDAATDGTTAYPLAKAFDSMQAVLRFEARNGRELLEALPAAIIKFLDRQADANQSHRAGNRAPLPNAQGDSRVVNGFVGHDNLTTGGQGRQPVFVQHDDPVAGSEAPAN